jgi:uncharacterized protein YdeI (YjbR/CyaY-like superfamily)
MARDPRIDEKIAQAAPFARPILEHLRELVHRTVPEVGETVKWGMPHFTYKGKNIAGMAAFKAHCAFMIHGEGRQGAAATEGGGMGSFGKIARIDDLPAEADLSAKLREAMARIEGTGLARQRKTATRAKPTLEIPQDFASALAARPSAQACFDGLAPSHRYEYLEWITGAKREGTRAKRIGEAVAMLAESKRRNWKYER